MEIMTRESFTKWAKKHDWLQITEATGPNGRNITFLTPSGNMMIVMFDLKGNLAGLGQPVPAPQPQPQKLANLLKRP